MKPQHTSAPALAFQDEVEFKALINRVEYVLQGRQAVLEHGLLRHEYRILLNGEVIRDWVEGDLLKHFSSHTDT